MDNLPTCAQGSTSGRPALKLKSIHGKKGQESLISSPRTLVLFNEAALDGSAATIKINSTPTDHSNYVEGLSSHHRRTKAESLAQGSHSTGPFQRSSLKTEEHIQSATPTPLSPKESPRHATLQESPQFLASPETTHRPDTASGLESRPIIPYPPPEQSFPTDREALPPALPAPSTPPTSMIVSAPQAHYPPKSFGTPGYVHAAPPGLVPVSFHPASAIVPVPDGLPRLPESVGDYESRACFLLSSAELSSHLRVLKRNIQIYAELMPDLMTRGAILDGDWFKVRQDGMRIIADLGDYCRWQMKQKYSKSTTYLETLKLTEEVFSYLQWMEKYRYNFISHHEVGCVGVVLSLLDQLCKAFERKS